MVVCRCYFVGGVGGSSSMGGYVVVEIVQVDADPPGVVHDVQLVRLVDGEVANSQVQLPNGHYGCSVPILCGNLHLLSTNPVVLIIVLYLLPQYIDLSSLYNQDTIIQLYQHRFKDISTV
jgi:hypothetical protein